MTPKVTKRDLWRSLLRRAAFAQMKRQKVCTSIFPLSMDDKEDLAQQHWQSRYNLRAVTTPNICVPDNRHRERSQTMGTILWPDDTVLKDKNFMMTLEECLQWHRLTKQCQHPTLKI